MPVFVGGCLLSFALLSPSLVPTIPQPRLPCHRSLARTPRVRATSLSLTVLYRNIQRKPGKTFPRIHYSQNFSLVVLRMISSSFCDNKSQVSTSLPVRVAMIG